ncbi:PWWP domain-containing protein 3-like [Rhododendron vialii]|uniref:PWWP domain-containing protein 3-like n=1 Tax=Rhododendron vialii TaxID=182163 RepID=UPI00265E858D|nr:PWWP domain-containing protein 3-like [Rhododendron vialii]
METDTTKTLADENGGNPGEKPKENLGNEFRLGEDGEQTGEGGRNLEGNGDGNENEEDGEEEGDGGEEHEYFVGDLVWGKIRGYPWWPGQIYHPSDASERATMYNQRERLLVAYFDGSFSWCRRSQLKPFAEDFEEMSKQSDSKSFLNALQKAVEGIGRLVESKMSCSCVSSENRFGLDRPWAENAGIRQGVLVPEGGPRRISIPRHGPARVIATVKYIAEVGCTTGMLELTMLKSFLSAFYRAKGGHKLAVYQEPLQIEELEDKNRNWESDVFDFSSSGEEVKGGRVPLLQKCYRRKKKSVANGKRKRKRSHFAPPLGRKRGRKEEAELSGSPKSSENEVLSAKHGSGGGEEAEAKQDNVSSIENGDKIAEEGTENVCVARERKQSKYLSPPSTSLKWVLRSSRSKRELEAESVKIAESLGERMIRVADQLIGSPPIAKCGETFQEKLPNEFDNPRSPHPPGDWKKIINSMEINASTKEVVFEQRSAAQNPVYFRVKDSVDRVGRFISAFRSALFLNGSNYKMYHCKCRSGGKRKSSGVDKASPGLLPIKQNLEMMTQMLEKADGNMLPEMKSDLESEMKSLLEKNQAAATAPPGPASASQPPPAAPAPASQPPRAALYKGIWRGRKVCTVGGSKPSWSQY